MEVLLLLTAGAMCITCFIVGAKVGQTTAKGEKIETPTFNPLKLVKKYNDEKEAEAEQKRLDTIMRNIERYDGTAQGQEDVPG